jgi:hypothetical protein
LQPGESKTVNFQLSADDLAFYDRNNQIRVESGKFKITIGNKMAFFELVSDSE